MYNPNIVIAELTKETMDLQEEIVRLKLENSLLRKASEEQRELNGELRVEIQDLEIVVTQLEKENSLGLT
jgi:hypothetical protein